MADRVVGRAVEDRSPALASVPLAGRVLQPDRETVVALEPDVVLVWAGLDPADLREALAGTGAEVVPLRLDRIDDVGPAWRAVGRAVGRANRAAELADDLRAELTPLGRDAPLPAPRVLWVVGDRPLVVAGAGTVLDDLLRTVGAANALGLEGPPWPRPGFEALAAMDPDLVLWSAPEAPPGPGLHPWSALPAVGHGRVRRLDPDTSLEAGPDLAALAHTIYRLVHGVPAPTAPHTS